MKVLVPVKRVLDFNLKVRVKPDGSGVDLSNLKMSINPFDEIAIEEAVRMKEGGGGHKPGAASEVVAVSIGPEQAQEIHAFIRRRIAGKNEKVASGMKILYGGSVKGANASQLFAQPDVDGGLIGGASLVGAEFMAICRAAERR